MSNGVWRWYKPRCRLLSETPDPSRKFNDESSTFWGGREKEKVVKNLQGWEWKLFILLGGGADLSRVEKIFHSNFFSLAPALTTHTSLYPVSHHVVQRFFHSSSFTPALWIGEHRLDLLKVFIFLAHISTFCLWTVGRKRRKMEKQDGNFCSFLKFHRFAFSSDGCASSSWRIFELGERENWKMSISISQQRRWKSISWLSARRPNKKNLKLSMLYSTWLHNMYVRVRQHPDTTIEASQQTENWAPSSLYSFTNWSLFYARETCCVQLNLSFEKLM